MYPIKKFNVVSTLDVKSDKPSTFFKFKMPYSVVSILFFDKITPNILNKNKHILCFDICWHIKLTLSVFIRILR